MLVVTMDFFQQIENFVQLKEKSKDLVIGEIHNIHLPELKSGEMKNPI